MPSGVLALAVGVAPVAAPVTAAGVVPVALSFLGAFLTGAVVLSVVLVAVLVVFLAGEIGVVFDVADCVVLAGLEATVFLVACWLGVVLATLLTLAGGVSAVVFLLVVDFVHCSALLCFLRSVTRSVILRNDNNA